MISESPLLRNPRIIGYVLILCAVVFFIGLGSYPFTDRDEGLYATVMFNMEKSGDYFIPEINGQKFLDKPILAYWIAAFSQKVFGSNEFALRAGSAFSAVLLLLFMGFVCHRVTGCPLTSVLILVSTAFTPLFAVVAKAFLVDMPLVLFTTASLLCFFMATETDSKSKALPWYLGFWTALSLGFLTKGPVAPAVIFPSALIYSISQGKTLSVLKRSIIPAGILIFIAVNFWYAVIYQRLGNEFIHEFFINQIFKRGTKSLVGHAGIPFYYLLIITLFTYPFFPSALSGFMEALYKWRKGRLCTQVERLIFFSAIIVISTVGVFTMAATKLPHYILPAVPFLGILSGYYLARLFNRTQDSKIPAHAFMGFHMVISIMFIVAAIIIYFKTPAIWGYAAGNLNPDKNEYGLPLNPPSMLFPVLVVTLTGLMVLVAILFFRIRKPEKMVLLICFSGFFFCLMGFLSAVPVINSLQEPAKRLGGDLRRRAPDDALIATYGLWKPSLFFYVGKEMKRFRSDSVEGYDNLSKCIKGDESVYVLTRSKFKDKLEKMPGFVVISQYGAYMLGGNTKAKSDLKDSN